jgi:hypothetical protein
MEGVPMGGRVPKWHKIIVNEDHVGHPITSRTLAIFDRVNSLVQEDRPITVT